MIFYGISHLSWFLVCTSRAVTLPRSSRSRSNLHWLVLCGVFHRFTVLDFFRKTFLTSVQPMFVVVKGRIPAVLQNAILLELDRCNCVFSAVVLPRGGRSRSSLHWRVLCYLYSGFTVVDFSETLLSTSVQPSFVVGTGGILPPLQNKWFSLVFLLIPLIFNCILVTRYFTDFNHFKCL